ncbi:hypothetical protein C8R44DRAFT_745929 [Mycena epipterygia]|nr:hypothetical protein C8R44DRAFT_745929 [Mycena epipterygia]
MASSRTWSAIPRQGSTENRGVSTGGTKYVTLVVDAAVMHDPAVGVAVTSDGIGRRLTIQDGLRARIIDSMSCPTSERSPEPIGWRYNKAGALPKAVWPIQANHPLRSYFQFSLRVGGSFSPAQIAVDKKSGNPCERCIKKGLKCEYFPVADQDGELPTPTSKTQTLQLAPDHRSAPPNSAQHTNPSYSPGPPVDPQFQRIGPPNPGSSYYYPSPVPPSTQYRYPPYPNQSVAPHHQSSNPDDVYNRAPSRTLPTFYSDGGAPLNPPGIHGYDIDGQSHRMGTIPAPYAWQPPASLFMTAIFNITAHN